MSYYPQFINEVTEAWREITCQNFCTKELVRVAIGNQIYGPKVPIVHYATVPPIPTL